MIYMMIPIMESDWISLPFSVSPGPVLVEQSRRVEANFKTSAQRESIPLPESELPPPETERRYRQD
jgi:hypothetical protein